MPISSHRAKSASTSSGRIHTRSTSQRGDLKISEPVPYTFTHTTLTPEEQQVLLEGPIPTKIDGIWPRKHSPVVTEAYNTNALHIPELEDNRPPSAQSAVISSMSSKPSKSSLYQDAERANGIRATIKRMFGSRRYRTPSGEARKESYMSDPGTLLPIEDLQTGPRLGGKSTHYRPSRVGGPSTLRAQQTVHQRQLSHAKSLTDISGTLRRRNTLPSLTFSDQEAQSFSKSLKDVMGFDVSNDVQHDTTLPPKDNHYRRSKSVNALAQRYVTDQPTTTDRQDRDSKVVYWRDSTAFDLLPERSPQISELDVVVEMTDHIKEVPSLEQIIKPAQSFDFGLAGQRNEHLDLEDRVNTLEVKMFDFEYAIAKLQGVDLSKPKLPTRPTQRKSGRQVASKASMQSMTSSSSTCSQPLPSPESSPIISATLRGSPRQDRSSKATTVRPLRASKSQQSIKATRTSYHLTPVQYDNLMSMIEDEKAARQQMEMHIVDLQKEIELLHAPVYARINYPTPSPESTRFIAGQKKLHRSPPFRFSKPPIDQVSRFSMTESDSESAHNEFRETKKGRKQDFESASYETSTKPFSSSINFPEVGVVS